MSEIDNSVLRNSNKLEYLDGLRGTAAFIVVLWHFAADFFPASITMSSDQINIYQFESLIGQTPLLILFNGSFAVAIFFVLSGYVLTYRFFCQPDQNQIIKATLKRYPRLLIPALFSILLAYFLLQYGLMFNHQAAVLTHSPYLDGFYKFYPDLINALYEAFVGIFLGTSCNYNAVLWTINTEFLGSLLVFSVVYLTGTKKYRIFIYFILSLFYWKNQLICFVFGLILADLFNSQNIFKGYMHKTINESEGIILFGSGLLSAAFLQGNTLYLLFIPSQLLGFIDVNLMHIQSIGATLVIMGVLISKKLQTFFSTDVLLFLGAISFSMYVLHRIVITSLSSLIFSQCYPHMSYGTSFLITFSCSIPVIFSISYIFYRYVDKTGIKVSNIISQKIFTFCQLMRDIIYKTI